MTVRDLIKELKELPQDLPVVTDYKEITDVSVDDSFYFLDSTSKTGYDIGPAVVLE
jgi:hypothetical protein